MNDEQERRVAQNEDHFRDANERMKATLDESFDENLDAFSVVCECADTRCRDMILVTADQYKSVRSDAKWFIVKADHIVPATEEPVEKTDEFWIIKKTGHAGEVAASLA